MIEPWLEALTAWDWVSQDDLNNRVISVVLRQLNNLIVLNWDNELYTDLQLADWIASTDTLPVWVLTWRVLQADGWLATGTLLVAKTTSGDEIRFLFADDGKLYTDNWTGTFKQIYLKPEVDALFTQLRWELSTVAFSGDYNDLLNKPTLGTASSKDVGTSAWNVPVLDSNWMLDPNIVPSTWVMNTFTVTNKSDLTTLTTAVKWDIWIVTSENKTYILSTDPYSTLSNWTELLFPTWSVSSVNGFTWAVVLTTWYVQESGDNLYVSTVEKATWNNKLWTNNVATVALTGNYGDLNSKPVIDSAMSSSSTNAVQNKVIKAYVDSTASWSASAVIDDTAYGSSWDGDTTHAPSKNAVYDKVSSIASDVSTLQTNVTNLWTWKQDTLVSWTNIKTVNSNSLLWSWDVTVQETLVSGTNIKTINNNSLLWSGNITISWGDWATIWWIVDSGTMHTTTYNNRDYTDYQMDVTYTFTWYGFVILNIIYWLYDTASLYINWTLIISDVRPWTSAIPNYYVWPFTVRPWDTIRLYTGGTVHQDARLIATVYDF